MITGHGTTFTWGTVNLSLTSISVSASGSETEITSMSSTVVTDPENTQRKRVARDYDTGLLPEVEVAVEFVAGTWINSHNKTEWVGLKRMLTLTLPSDDKGTSEGMRVESQALCTQFGLNISTGEYVRGNASFRLSGL